MAQALCPAGHPG